MTWANDNLASAAAVSGSSGSITPLTYDSTVDPATSETGEDVSGIGETLWWKWTAPSSGDFEFATVGSPSADADPNGLDTKLQIFSGLSSGPTHAALTYIDSNDDNAAGDTYQYNSRVIFTAVSGTTYYVQTDMYSSGQAGTLHLAWAPYVVPPPAPTAGSWSSSGTYDPHTLFPGDDATVSGTDLDTVTTVTIGGVSQPFTATSPTSLVVHANSSAISGPIVVSNSSGSDPATGSATVLYPGPWTYPPDQNAEDISSFTGQASAYGATVDATSQPSLVGDPTTGTQGAFFALSASGGGTNPTTAITWDQLGTIVVLDERDSTYTMPDYIPTTSDPTVVDSQVNGTDTPVPTSDLTIAFDPTMDSGGGEYDEDSNGRTISEDLWQMHVEYRRLDPADWYFDSVDTFRPKFVGDAWPSGLTSKTVDYDRLARNPVDSLSLSSASVWTDNRASLSSVTDYGYLGDLTVTWADFGTSRAWAVAFSVQIDGTAITPPVIDPDPALRTGSVKHWQGIAFIRARWTYRPRRYRYLYDTPPAAAAVQTLRRRQQAAPVGSAPRRRQIANRAGSLRRGPGAAP